MINELHIENFKCFGKKTIPMNALTVLAGINGVGKSSIIQAWLLIRQVRDQVERAKRTNGEILGSDLDFIVKLEGEYALDLGNSKNVTCSYTDSDHFRFVLKNAIDDSVTINLHASSKEAQTYAELLAPSEQIYKLSEFFPLVPIGHKTFHYLQAERLGPKVTQHISSSKFIHTGCKGEFTGYAMYKAEKDRIEVQAEKCFPKTPKLFLKQVEAWMDTIVPGVKISSQLIEEINAVKLGIRKVSSETDYLQPSNIGFGISYVLPIVVTGLVAEKGSMVIVENPEAHLHPSGQSNIGFFLAKVASAGVQVVIETHSEHVINGIRLAAMKEQLPHDSVTVNFFSQADKTPMPDLVSITLNEHADLSEWPRGFFDQQERDLAEIFKLKRKKK